MGDVLRERLRDSRAAVVAVFRNRALRRVALARPAAALSVSASNVVFLVVAYQAGGATAVGTVLVVRTIAIATAAPLGALFGDRYPRHLVMAVADAARAAMLVGAAIANSGDTPLAPILIVSTLVGLVVGS